MNDHTHPIYAMEKEEILSQLLEKECAYYRSVLELTQAENGYFQRKRPLNEITPLMKKKKILLSCIDEIESALSPLKKYWKTKPNHTDNLSTQVREQLTSLNTVLLELLELDRVNQQLFQEYQHSFRKAAP